MHCNITFSARFRYRPNFKLALHTHENDWQIQLVYEGNGTVVINDKTYTAAAGDLFYVSRGSSHRFTAGPNGMKTLEVKFIAEDPEDPLIKGVSPYLHVHDNSLFDLFSRIVSEGTQKATGYKVMCESLVEQVVVVLARLSSCERSLGSLPYPTERNSETSPVIEAVNEYVFSHLNVSFSMEDLAKGCGYNQDYIYRTIKKQFGISAIAYINQIRFEQAKTMMEHTNLPLSEIAWNLGFSSIQYFSKFFRHYADMAPSAYCEKVRHEVRIDY